MKDIKEKISERISISFAKNPGRVVLFGIFILNIILVFGAAVIIVAMHPEQGFWTTVYHVFTMILDAGGITSIVDESSQIDAALAVFCIVVIILGTLIFTGAVIGYLTNIISDLITSANSGARRLRLSDHIVFINWNNRAAEIINDLMYSDRREKVVVLVNENREAIQREINNRIADTEEREWAKAFKEATALIKDGKLHKSQRFRYAKSQVSLKVPTIIVREGETYSLKQLHDIAIHSAKTVIVLGKDDSASVCKYDLQVKQEKNDKGNIHTVKTLVQVAQITASEESADNQKVVVEVEDDWTGALVDKIINHKVTRIENNPGTRDKCNIVPIPVNKILGQILSQFSIMPELNTVYSELFSNRGAAFYSTPFKETDELGFFSDFLKTHTGAIPVSVMESKKGPELFYVAGTADDINTASAEEAPLTKLELADEYRFEKRHIAILGHNSKSIDILEGFEAFIAEWDNGCREGLVDILIIDDREHLEKVNYYRTKDGADRPYIGAFVETDVYGKDLIQDKLNTYIDAHPEDTSVLILSDDNATAEELDANALTYLIYVQDIINERLQQNPDFNVESIDVIVELLNPKNYDVARSYSVDNVIISNRYISKMVAQVGEKDAIYDFYKDILTYDLEADGDAFTSKELYIKVAGALFKEGTAFPLSVTPRSLTRSVFEASPKNNKTIVLGYIPHGKECVLFSDCDNSEISIDSKDKLVVFAPH
ncbi:MAG: hypothetical protein IJ168_04620 [Eubacterium sp.]|nr:hypothetical protein [Eubacterium sp.]